MLFKPTNSDEYNRKISKLIEEVGWTFVAIASEKKQGMIIPAYAYTIGLTLKGYPEIITFGLPVDIFGSVLRIVVNKLLAAPMGDAGGHPLFGQEIQLNPEAKGMLIETPTKVTAEYALSARRVAEQAKVPLSFYQFVWSDANNKLPWEEGFNEGFRPNQPILRDRVLH